MKICDLHTHSTGSDGSFTPTELVIAAKANGVAALALTDHNTAKGLPEFTAAGKAHGLITVPGCEFTTAWGKTELHVVGLFLPERSWPEVERQMDALRRAKHESNVLLIEKLRQRGCDITYEETAALTDADEFNRAHVARVLQAKGCVHSLDQAFDTLLKEGNGCYFPAKRPDVFERIRFIRSIGGVPVLAHPFQYRKNDEELRELIEHCMDHGLKGMECRYSGYGEEKVAYLEALAGEYGLVKTGGSDFHGDNKPHIQLGTGIEGELDVPYAWLEKLKEIAGK